MSIDLRLNIEGNVDEKQFYKEDLRKAMKISLYSFLSATIVTVALYLITLVQI